MNNVIDEHEYLVADLSFWDNKQTRTGYPGIKRKKNGGGVKELLVGHAYKFKDVIDFSTLNWDDSKAVTNDAGMMELSFGNESTTIIFSKFMSDSPNMLVVNNTNTTGSYRSFWYVNNFPEEIPVPENTWVNFNNNAEPVSAPVIIIPENEFGTDYNDLAPFFEKEVTDAPIIMIGNFEPIYLSKKYDTWADLINTDVQQDINACVHPSYDTGFEIINDNNIQWGNRLLLIDKETGVDIKASDAIIYCSDSYSTLR